MDRFQATKQQRRCSNSSEYFNAVGYIYSLIVLDVRYFLSFNFTCLPEKNVPWEMPNPVVDRPNEARLFVIDRNLIVLYYGVLFESIRRRHRLVRTSLEEGWEIANPISRIVPGLHRFRRAC